MSRLCKLLNTLCLFSLGALVSCTTILDLPYTCTSFGYRRVDDNWVIDDAAYSVCYMTRYSIYGVTDCASICTADPSCVGFEHTTSGSCVPFSCSSITPGDYARYSTDLTDYFKDDGCLSSTIAPGTTMTPIVYKCYSNGTVEVTNPNPILYTHVMAVQYQGSSVAMECKVAVNGAKILLNGCSMDTTITLFLSDRVGGNDYVFVGQNTLAFGIMCAEISQTGVAKTVSKQLGATLVVTTELPVTPSFAISSAIRVRSATGAVVSTASVGDDLYWTIDIPEDYIGSPTCTAYSGTSMAGSPSKQLMMAGCSSDQSLMGDFDNEVTSVPHEKRLWAVLYAFKFYNSDYIYLHCTVKLCPSVSNQCDIKTFYGYILSLLSMFNTIFPDEQLCRKRYPAYPERIFYTCVLDRIICISMEK